MAVARPRLLASAVVAIVAYAALPGWHSRALLAWDAGVLLYLILVWAMMLGSDADRLRRRADDEDAGAVAVLVLTMLAAAASFAAIAADLREVAALKGSDRVGPLSLAAGTILLSWVFAQTSFTVHYAHDFYAGTDDRRGLAFPGTAQPDYLDFAYFAFTIGAASQTSDVSIDTPRMRRFVLAHTVLSFLFNTTVLALAINVGAGLL